MADRRTAERLLVQPDHVGDITYGGDNPGPVAVEKVGERLIVPPESLDRVGLDETRPETEDRTEPIRLSFLALLAERDPLVQARLNIRRAHAAVGSEAETDEDRPTDPMVLTGKFSG